MSRSGGKFGLATAIVPAPTGVAATDMAMVQAAVNAVNQPTGVVQLAGGSYAFNSSSRTDTVSNAISTTWSDTSGSLTPADVGKYVLAQAGNQRVPKILTVTPGTGFTTDVAPTVTITSQPAQIVQPSIVVPYGVRIQGIGRFSTQQFENPSSSTVVGTKTVDTGTGISFLGVGSTTYGGDGISLGYMGIWGSASGSVGNTFCGVYLGDNNWFSELERVDLSWHGTAGLIMDANINALDSHNSSYQNNGKVATTTPSGGVLTEYYQSQTSSGMNFYNDFFFNNYGMGIGGGPFTSGIGKVASVTNSQIANTFQTSFGTYSGFGLVLHSDIGGAEASVLNCWMGTNQTGDFWLNGGAMTLLNTVCTSATNTVITTYGALDVRGCQLWSNNANAITIGSGGSVTYGPNTLAGSATNLYAGGPTQAQMGMGSSTGIGPGAGAVGAASSNQLWQGSGVPSASAGVNGDLYLRTDTPGTANQRLYIKAAGAWTPLTV